jgi:hypothetical protein
LLDPSIRARPLQPSVPPRGGQLTRIATTPVRPTVGRISDRCAARARRGPAGGSGSGDAPCW